MMIPAAQQPPERAAAIPPAIGDAPFAARDQRGGRALSWWRRHCDPAERAEGRPVDPGSRARLRRARSTLDALLVPAAVALAREVGALAGRGSDLDVRARTALDLARVLAHVKEHEPRRHTMQLAGWQAFPYDRGEGDAGGDRPLLSEARFRRLMLCADGEEQVTAFTRLLALLGGRANVAQIAADFLDWSHPTAGPRVRERWAFQYYAAGGAAPPPPTTDAEDDSE